MILACLDVHYHSVGATSACVVFNDWTDSEPAGTTLREHASVNDYEPGRFYLRELPCILDAVATLPKPPQLIVIDGYVWLSDDHTPGLGAHLHAALGGAAAVIGVAKSRFVGAPALPVLRGRSRVPLYVSAVGVPLPEAASHIGSMHGRFRIPTLLKLADQLCRGHVGA